MHVIFRFVVGLVLAMLLSACVPAPEQGKAKVYCPACGTEFDAIFQKRF
jgi:hypothetical protein